MLRLCHAVLIIELEHNESSHEDFVKPFVNIIQECDNFCYSIFLRSLYVLHLMCSDVYAALVHQDWRCLEPASPQ